MRTAPRLDHYRLLGVGPDAGPDEISAAYRLRAQVCHPDRLSGSSDKVKAAASELMSLLNEARAVLSDPQSRTDYDVERRNPEDTQEVVALTVDPQVITLHDVTPGWPVDVAIQVQSPTPQFGDPRVHAADPGLVIDTVVDARSSRSAEIRMRIHTRLLADNRRYRIELLAEWGAAVGVVTLDVSTAELQTWSDDDGHARMRHPSARSRRRSGKQRRNLLRDWALGGFATPVFLTAWSRGLIGLPLNSWTPWLGIAALIIAAAGLYTLIDSRGFSLHGRPAGRAAAPGQAVLHLGAAIRWTANKIAGAVRSLANRR